MLLWILFMLLVDLSQTLPLFSALWMSLIAFGLTETKTCKEAKFSL